MKILLLNYEYPPVGGGGGHVSHQLARELVKMGHEIDAITMSYKGATRFQKNNDPSNSKTIEYDRGKRRCKARFQG